MLSLIPRPGELETDASCSPLLIPSTLRNGTRSLRPCTGAWLLLLPAPNPVCGCATTYPASSTICTARTPGPWPSRWANWARRGCNAYSMVRTGMSPPSARPFATMSLSISATPRASSCSMKPAFSRRVAIRRGSPVSIVARPGASKTAKSVFFGLCNAARLRLHWPELIPPARVDRRSPPLPAGAHSRRDNLCHQTRTRATDVGPRLGGGSAGPLGRRR
jgi:hypothetical protein